MDEWTAVIVAAAGMLGAGGVVAATLTFIRSWRDEGVANAPGEIVFERQDKLLTALQQQVSAQAQHIATLTDQVNTLTKVGAQRELEVAEYRVANHRLEKTVEELEFRLSEEQQAREADRRSHQREIAGLESQIGQLRAASSSAGQVLMQAGGGDKSAPAETGV